MPKSKKCDCLPSIETLNTITEHSGKETKISRDRVISMNQLITELMDSNFDKQEVSRIIDGLKRNRCPIPMIQTRILSVFAFHEAMEPSGWPHCRGEWILACERLEINKFSVGQAISVGQNIRTQFYQNHKGKKQLKNEIRKEVQKVFFGSKRVIKILK